MTAGSHTRHFLVPAGTPRMPVVNDDFRIEKERLAVAVTTMSGERLRGDLFVQRYARYRPGREEAVDVLNSDEPYFPLALAEDDSTLLIAKACVRDVALPRADAADDRPRGRPATVEVVLVGGEALLGEVLLEVPVQRPRLLDFLNRVTQRFIPLHTADGIRLVNSRLIERVRPLD